eukprot:TRINITY_DN56580_c0_g1_i1.p1 TRINITY_DN56580_c0_g1~~TRINITY_DN56580_c0_g1_i1.p1  ORF type:complete len:323 (-),score=50.58 TRINITY_DN56580_c0_g1_i1:61-1029(-)
MAAVASPAAGTSAVPAGTAGSDSGAAGQKQTFKPSGKSNSTPGPGEYVWKDDTNMKKKPKWSMTSPDRKNLDLMLGTWTPASQSLQPRAPDPGEYVCPRPAGYNGVYSSPQFSWRGSGRACLAPDPKAKVELHTELPSTVAGHHPTRTMSAKWSVYGKDRSMLPMGVCSWTPQNSTDVRPGPGQYDLDRVGKKWKAGFSRRGCSWGGRTTNLHPEVRGWVPQTFGSRLLGGEVHRLDIYPNKGCPKRRCSCIVCPGPFRCDHEASPRSRLGRASEEALSKHRKDPQSDENEEDAEVIKKSVPLGLRKAGSAGDLLKGKRRYA